jgi:hypothetical protein
VKLTSKEQRNVRAALRYLAHRAGGWAPVGVALERSAVTLTRVAGGRRPVGVELAYGVARAAGTSLDALLAGTLGICPHCGRHPEEGEFDDEGTVTEDKPREAMLKLLK